MQFSSIYGKTIFKQAINFGVHCKSYYSLEVSYFKSVMDKRLLDSLWNHYWVNTLSSSSLITNAEYTTG
jgi:COP9 signalosome complex subunit 5